MRPVDTSTVVLSALKGSRRARIMLVERCPDLALVNELALLQLAAGRLGWTVSLRDPCPRVAELIELAGLADLLDPGAGSALEAGGEPESSEELGVEEVVEPGDPPP